MLNAFHRSLPDTFPLVIIGVNVWDTPSGIRSFLHAYPMAFLNGRDLSGTAGARFGLTGVPETFLVDPDGMIQDHILGPVPPMWLEEVRRKVETARAANGTTPSS